MARIAVSAFLAVLAFAPAEAAGLSARVVAPARVAVAANVLVCPDTHCGQRAYPDPYLPDGWRGSEGRSALWPDVRTWHRLRTMRFLYADHGILRPPN